MIKTDINKEVDRNDILKLLNHGGIKTQELGPWVLLRSRMFRVADSGVKGGKLWDMIICR